MVATRPRVVIVGAGFGGLWAARTLCRLPVDVLVLDRNNYHTFFPLLYQVAAAEVEPEAIVYPLRSIFRGLKNVCFGLAEVQQVDLPTRAVQTSEHSYAYDYLILATGSTSHYFGIPGAEQYAFPLKTLAEGVALRNHILCCFERAAQETDPQQRRRLLTFVIIGGGPTGVEFAGALAELIRGPLVKDYPGLDFRLVRLVLLEARDSLLGGLPHRLRDYSRQRLGRMGVEVHLGAAARRITPVAVELADGSQIPTETVAWTAGVKGSPGVDAWGLPVARNGLVPVLPSLQAPGHPEVYVIGDLAFAPQDGQPLSMIAPVAIQQGVAAAQNIGRQIDGLAALPFQYRDPGTVATIGRNAAVAQVWGRSFTGFPAWVLWLSIHIYKLIGFRNRLVVLINWAWDYLFYEKAVRLILPTAEARDRGC